LRSEDYCKELWHKTTHALRIAAAAVKPLLTSPPTL
jgi:hypothetical protein